MLRIYTVDISALPDQPGELPLSSYRLKQLSSCRIPQRRRQGLGAELLLIHALRDWKGSCTIPLCIETGSDGKPFLSEESLFFSLSHTGETAACAVCDAPVGIDIEEERPLRESVLRRCFSEEEQRLILESEHPSASFTELWTKKESYLKATGEGLRSLREIDLLSPPENAFFYYEQRGTLHFSVCVLGCPAVPERIENVELSEEMIVKM